MHKADRQLLPTGQAKTQAVREHLCPHCSQPMACIQTEPRPAWREVFYGPDHPQWFEWVTSSNFPPSDDLPDKDEAEMLELTDTQPASGDIFDEIIWLLKQARE